MKRLNIFKFLIITGLLSISSSAWAKGVAFGSANVSTCELHGGRNLREEAIKEAKINADKECQSATFDAEEAEITEVHVLDSYRGSCWAGTNSGLAVKIEYECLYDSEQNSKLIETTTTVLSCPENPTDEINIDEYYFRENLQSEAKKFCGNDEVPVFRDVTIGNSSVGWGGTDPLCGFYRRTQVNLKFVCSKG